MTARILALTVATLVGAAVSGLVAVVGGLLAGSLATSVCVLALLAGPCAGWMAWRSARLSQPEVGSRSLWDGVALAALVVVGVRQFVWLAFERHGTLLMLSPNNYGDLPLHWTYIQYMASGARFWPDNPILAGNTLHYPLGADLLAALFVRLGADVVTVMKVTGLVATALLGVGLLAWGRGFALAMFLFSGSLMGLRFFMTGELVDHTGTAQWKNLFLTLFLPQRGFLFGLPAGLLLLVSFRARLLRGRPGFAPWIEGTLWAALPLFHIYTFGVVSLVAGLWALTGHRVRAALPSLAVAIVPATLLVLGVTGSFGAARVFRFHPGWTIGTTPPWVFFPVNFGVLPILALGALVSAIRRRAGEEWACIVPAVLGFVLLFLFAVAPWPWDNTKVMLWCFVLALPVMGAYLARLPSWLRVSSLGALLVPGVVTQLGAMREARVPLVLADAGVLRGVCGVVEDLPRGVRFATMPTYNHPVALCGGGLVEGYPGHLWSHGVPFREVELQLDRLMRGAPGWEATARALGARYLYWGEEERARFSPSTRAWAVGRRPIASGAWGTLWDLEARDESSATGR